MEGKIKHQQLLGLNSTILCCILLLLFFGGLINCKLIPPSVQQPHSYNSHQPQLQNVDYSGTGTSNGRGARSAAMFPQSQQRSSPGFNFQQQRPTSSSSSSSSSNRFSRSTSGVYGYGMEFRGGDVHFQNQNFQNNNIYGPTLPKSININSSRKRRDISDNQIHKESQSIPSNDNNLNAIIKESFQQQHNSNNNDYSTINNHNNNYYHERKNVIVNPNSSSNNNNQHEPQISTSSQSQLQDQRKTINNRNSQIVQASTPVTLTGNRIQKTNTAEAGGMLRKTNQIEDMSKKKQQYQITNANANPADDYYYETSTSLSIIIVEFDVLDGENGDVGNCEATVEIEDE